MRNPNFTILFAEDNEDDCILIKRALQKLGVASHVQFVSNGVQAIAYLEGKGVYGDRQRYPYPSFLITDLKMPGGDGMSVLVHLKKNPERSIIPTAVFSASQDVDDIKTCYALGASSYHIKPVLFVEFQKIIQSLYEYWCLCEVPEVDETGKQIPTPSEGKLGERYRQGSKE